MATIRFTVPAVPVSQPAKDHRMVKSKDGRQFIASSTPAAHKVNAFKATAAMAARDAYQGAPLDGPLRVSLVFVFPRPSGCPSWLNKMDYPQLFADWKCGYRVPYAAKKHDRDNLMKSLQDALNGVVWKDDGLIFAGPVEKWLAAEDEQPHVTVEIETL